MNIVPELKKRCLEDLIRKAPAELLQKLVNNRTPERLAYAYPYTIEDYFKVKKGTHSFGIVASEIFSEFKADSIELEEITREIQYHKRMYKNSYSIDKKVLHSKECNRLCDIERELYKPIRKFVKLCNKIKNEK